MNTISTTNSKEVRMERGENYLITYRLMNNKTKLATFLEEVNGMYLFKDNLGEFAITINKVINNEISIEIVED